MQIKISPSLLAADFSRLAEEVRAMDTAGAAYLHLDVMDGHFVPNISMGPCVISALRAYTSACFDVHLMISEPLRYIEDYVKAGADLITFHTECSSNVQKTIDKIHAYGKGAGLAIKPATPASAILPYLDQIEMALVMTVEPGFGGQKFMEAPVSKVSELYQAAKEQGLELDIEVDGGISEQTAPAVCTAGANVLVAGSALFSKPDYPTAVRGLEKIASHFYKG
ncbi:MAG TPA: ribulose-phosphate 3-epimerase [Firmicutes bacterium]|nr:ribulose-phosphate 3-epimerase [Bacillota bacterium]